MADDLILKYFRDELTEAEEALLSERLFSSVEDAVRFGQMAQNHYYLCGLPVPHWPGGGPASGAAHSPSGPAHPAGTSGAGTAQGPWHSLWQGAAHLALKPILWSSVAAGAVVWQQEAKTPVTVPPVQVAPMPGSASMGSTASPAVPHSAVVKMRSKKILRVRPAVNHPAPALTHLSLYTVMGELAYEAISRGMWGKTAWYGNWTTRGWNRWPGAFIFMCSGWMEREKPSARAKWSFFVETGERAYEKNWDGFYHLRLGDGDYRKGGGPDPAPF